MNKILRIKIKLYSDPVNEEKWEGELIPSVKDQESVQNI